MFKYRVLTAVILIPWVFVGLFYTTPLQFLIITGLLYAYAAVEWSYFIVGGRWWRIFFMIFSMVLAALGVMILASHYFRAGLGVVLVCWLIGLWLVVTYPRYSAVLRHPFVASMIGILSLIPSFLALNYLVYYEPQGRALVLLLLLLVWGADTGAYIGGSLWGRHPLISRVSPKKSWEGLLAALLPAVCLAPWAASYLHVANLRLLALSLIVALCSVVGDLLESMMKRVAGLKDSGHFLPGHGGLLDRLDSLLSAAPVFLVLWWQISA